MALAAAVLLPAPAAEARSVVALTVAGAMLVLGVAIGAGRLGADVGGVVTVGAGGAAAVLACLPGPLTRRRIAVAVAVPVLALAALAALDLATGGNSHFTRTILGAESAASVESTIGRRYELAFEALTRGLMPLVAVACAALAVFAVVRRRTLYAPIARYPAWTAALAGGLAGSVAGALANDSGPGPARAGRVLCSASPRRTCTESPC